MNVLFSVRLKSEVSIEISRYWICYFTAKTTTEDTVLLESTSSRETQSQRIISTALASMIMGESSNGGSISLYLPHR